ncbi:MAG: LysM peptidoglycan-binding domain-containing protein [Chloroflexota bacterium]|nr:MAG: LysM peptidoglycan-binding domain-containing protein [Chloroflexota bacterium]
MLRGKDNSNQSVAAETGLSRNRLCRDRAGGFDGDAHSGGHVALSVLTEDTRQTMADKRPAGTSRQPDANEARCVADAAREAARATRRAGVRKAIRSVLSGVALSLLLVGGAIAAEEYVVTEGDTLNGIALRHGVTAAAMVRANGLVDSELIKPGQTLAIPEPERAALTTRGSRTGIPDAIYATTRNPFLWPLRGLVTTYFGEKGSYWRRGYHPGLDIGASFGSLVKAVGTGVVVESEESGYNSGYGSYVKIDHGGGLVSLYGHLDRVHMAVGDRVGPGDRIGTVGMTGFTTGPHLHLEFRQDGDVRDPIGYIGDE